MADLTVVNFTNIDNEEFDGMFGGVTYKVKAGETKQFPSFLAIHLAKQLAVKKLLRIEGNWGRDSFQIKELTDKILGKVTVPVEEAVETTTAPEPEQEFPLPPVEPTVEETKPQEPAEVQVEVKTKRGRKKVAK